MRFFGAFFVKPGDKPWQTRNLDSCAATNFDDRWSDFVLKQGASIAGSAALCPPLQGKTARSGTCRETLFC
jgi:hypothetical protein